MWLSHFLSTKQITPALSPPRPPAVSSLMQEYPPESILWGPYSISWDEGAVRDYLALLTPERMHLTVVSKVGRGGGREGRGKGGMRRNVGKRGKKGERKGGREGGREEGRGGRN